MRVKLHEDLYISGNFVKVIALDAKYFVVANYGKVLSVFGSKCNAIESAKQQPFWEQGASVQTYEHGDTTYVGIILELSVKDARCFIKSGAEILYIFDSLSEALDIMV